MNNKKDLDFSVIVYPLGKIIHCYPRKYAQFILLKEIYQKKFNRPFNESKNEKIDTMLKRLSDETECCIISNIGIVKPQDITIVQKMAIQLFYSMGMLSA